MEPIKARWRVHAHWHPCFDHLALRYRSGSGPSGRPIHYLYLRKSPDYHPFHLTESALELTLAKTGVATPVAQRSTNDQLTLSETLHLSCRPAQEVNHFICCNRWAHLPAGDQSRSECSKP